MPDQSNVSTAKAIEEHANVSGNRWHIKLVRVRSGVAAGSMRRYGTTTSAESWALFRSREQFEAYCAEDPSRFTDPLPHRQLQSAFVRIFDPSR